MKKYQFFFFSENFQFLEVKLSIQLNRLVFAMFHIDPVTGSLPLDGRLRFGLIQPSSGQYD